ncbi:MAG: hypothetical protein LBT08_07945 [Synergistaceae bacterium]|jgi:hypothetical protein|nr:hypothetical protein [Synergistaceae bacterium]
MMMTVNQSVNEKGSMLSISSTPQDMLRALYFYVVDYVIIQIEESERLLHKDQLIALLEHGRGDTSIQDVMSDSFVEPLSTKTQIEEIPQETQLLLFSQASIDSGRETLTKMDFREFREMKLKENTPALPEWWGIPLPLLHTRDDMIYLNDKALDLVPGGARSVATQMDKIREDRIITLKEGEKDRTFSLLPLTGDSYLIEDISGDFEMAEDLVWWAAIGRAFVRRMEDNGLAVKRLSPYENPPDDVAEVIQCSWDGEFMGRLAIEMPEGSAGGSPFAGAAPESAIGGDTEPKRADADGILEPSESKKPNKLNKTPEADKTLDSPEAKEFEGSGGKGEVAGQAEKAPAEAGGPGESHDAEATKGVIDDENTNAEADADAAAKAGGKTEEASGKHQPRKAEKKERTKLPVDIDASEKRASDSIKKNEARNAYGRKPPKAAQITSKENPAKDDPAGAEPGNNGGSASKRNRAGNESGKGR